MKKFIFLFVVMVLSLHVSAQFRVDSLGVVNINLVNNTEALRVKGGVSASLLENTISTDYPTYGDFYTALYGTTASTYVSSTRAYCGVRGVAGRGMSGYNYGVMGGLAYSSDGAAIYGSSSNQTQRIYGRFAGFFDGGVYITQELTTEGPILGMGGIYDYSEYASTNQNSNTTEYENLPLSERLADVEVHLINRQTFREDELDTQNNKEESSPTEQIHYAFDTESICKQFPEIVYEDEKGNTLVNYMELIPILVKSVNELSKRVDELEGENKQLRRVAADATGIDTSSVETADATAVRYDVSGRRLPQNTHQTVTVQKGKKSILK